MKVTVSSEAAEHIKKKSNGEPAVRIAVIQVKGGWCSSSQLSVEIGHPGDTKRFYEYEDNGVKVFIQKGLSTPNDQVDVNLSKVLFAKSLSVRGIRYWPNNRLSDAL